jgi:hypothetical protein
MQQFKIYNFTSLHLIHTIAVKRIAFGLGEKSKQQKTTTGIPREWADAFKAVHTVHCILLPKKLQATH